MKNKKIFIINYLIIIFLELILKLFTFKNIFMLDTIYIFLYSIPISSLLTLIIHNKKIYIISLIVITILYEIEVVYYQLYNSLIGISAITYTNQVMGFSDSITRLIIIYIVPIILLLMPVILSIIFYKKIVLCNFNYKYLVISIIISLLIYSTSFIDSNIYNLLYLTNSITNTTNKIGLLTSFNIDIVKDVINFQDKVLVNKSSKIEYSNIKYNVLDYKFDSFKSSNKQITNLNNYFNNEVPSNKNEYTGIFKDKNLIYITAEAFYPLAINKELTPTLYKLYSESMKFNNFYTPIYNCSTSDGEFISLLSLVPGVSTCSMDKTIGRDYPYSYGNVFTNLGYYTSAYHGGNANFYKRNITLPNLGYSNFMGCDNGLNDCSIWPRSDKEVIDNSTKYYLSKDKFMTYYMSISGHMEYNFKTNDIAIKNKELVNNLDANNSIKAYLATQIEFDKSLELLLSRLEENNLLESTVIIIAPDHYPYGLDMKDIDSYMNISDNYFDIFKNSLIIWNNGNYQDVIVNDYVSSLDILPTVLNLFGIEFDSRLLIGRDIFSSNEKIIIFNNRSWITNEAKYNYLTKEVTKLNDEVDKKYIDDINKIVNDKISISKLIVNTNYYDYLNYTWDSYLS